jgi:hypothetical protein
MNSVKYADGDDGHDGNVFKKQVPADKPADNLPDGHVPVGVCRSRPGDHASKLRVGECGGGARQARDQKRDDYGRSGAHAVRSTVRHETGQGENSDTNDAADPDGAELPEPEALEQSVLL